MSDNIFFAIAGITQDYLKGPKYPIDYRNYTNPDYKVKNESFYLDKLLSEEEIERMYNTLDKDMLVKWQILSEAFLERHLKDLNLLAILRFQVVSEGFLRRHCFDPKFEEGYHSLVIQTMLRFQGLSTEFILSIMDYIENYKLFHLLCTFQHIDSELMERLINDYTDTPYNNMILIHLLKYQEIPEEIAENHPYIKVKEIFRDSLSKHQNLSREFFKRNNIDIDSSILLTPDEWKFEIRSTGKFSTFNDYFIGYKIVRADNYSDFNYRFKYEKDNDYLTFSDPGYNRIGAGFGVMDEESAKFTLAKRFRNAAKFKIIEVKVFYEDLTYVAMAGNNVTIRTNEIYIL
jgi:hypothetical protein